MLATDEGGPVSDKVIFEAFGRLAYKFQLFDFSLAHVLGQVLGPGPALRSASEVREEIEEIFRLTSGKLSRKLKLRH